MDSITAVLILVGLSALLVGCTDQEAKNNKTVHLEIEPIPE